MSQSPGREPAAETPEPAPDAAVLDVPDVPGVPDASAVPPEHHRHVQPDPPSGRRRRLVTGLVALAAVTLVLDQATKAWALAALDEGVRHQVVGDLLGLQLLFNPGAALGLATGTTWLLTVVAVTVVVVIVRVSRRLGSRGWTVALGLLLGGALGNLVDRIIRDPGLGRGHVVDFIAYADWFVGNVADIAIVVAAGLLMLLSLRGVRLDGTREGTGPGAADDGVPADGPAGPVRADG